MPKRKYSAIPIDPNESGPDPQFGNLEDLPRGVKRQTSYIQLVGANLTNPKPWSRLVLSFPECLGIKETLDHAAKSTSCIPTVNMDVPINLPVIKDVKIDMVKLPAHYELELYKDANDGISNTALANDLAFILTGNDQLHGKAPSTADETKSLSVDEPAQMAALSEAIYAKIFTNPTANRDYELSDAIKPSGFTGVGWLYGKTVDGVKGLDYAEVAQRYLTPLQSENHERQEFEINNIMSKGHLLLKDHVNLFVKVPANASTSLKNWEIRLIIDYTVREVSLSSLLVWQQQLTEFLPQQVQWRVFHQDAEAAKTGYTVLISRGSITENGLGDDPTSKTDFPDIKD